MLQLFAFAFAFPVAFSAGWVLATLVGDLLRRIRQARRALLGYVAAPTPRPASAAPRPPAVRLLIAGGRIPSRRALERAEVARWN